MTKYFVAKENDEGEIEYVEVGANDLEVPETHPTVQAVEKQRAELLEEAIKRRKDIAKLKTQIEDLEKGSEEDTDPEPEEVATPLEILSPDELYAQFSERIYADMQRRENEIRGIEQVVSNTLTEFKLPKELGDVLKPFASDPEALKKHAATLASASLKFEDSGGGDGVSTPEFNPQRVFKEMGLDD